MNFSLSSALWDDDDPIIGSPLKLGSSVKIEKDQGDDKPREKPAEKSALFSLSTSLDVDVDDDDSPSMPRFDFFSAPKPISEIRRSSTSTKPLNFNLNDKKRKADQLVANSISERKGSPVSNVNYSATSGANKKLKLSLGSTPRSSPSIKTPLSSHHISSHNNKPKDKDKADDDFLPPHKVILWHNLVNSFAPELAESLQKDLKSTNTISIRSNTGRKPGYFLKQETDIITKYRNDYPFSGALSHALSILINRGYDQIRSRWFEENRFNSLSNLASVDGAIVKLLAQLEQFLKDEDTIESGLGPLAKEILQKIRGGQSLKVEDLNLGQIKEELKFYEQKRQYSAFNVDVAVELLSQDNCSVDKGVLKSKIPTPSVERTEKPTTKLTTMQNGAVINRYVWDDIAKGTLRYPLKCINEIDDEKPPVVEFLNQCVPCVDDLSASNALEFTPGCLCQGVCHQKTCNCAKEMHEQRFPYDGKGCLVNWPPGTPIYECNSNCQCDTLCKNRVLQKGVTILMEVYKTKNRGWGTRSLEPIPRGKFVCEYTGEHITNEEAERRGALYDKIQCSYLLDLDVEGKQTNAYTIDATHYGTISRYFNHSCDPNLVIHPVWVDDLDPRKPRIGLYAKRDIAVGEELTFDYKYETEPKKGQTKGHIVCRCGAKNCRGILY